MAGTTVNSRGFSGVYGKIDSPFSYNANGELNRPIISSERPATPAQQYVSAVKDYLGKTDPIVSASENLNNYNFYRHYGSGLSSGASGTPVSDQYDYYNAKLASIYKMDAETAYREALSNTSYQRAVEDLKAAGLNPVLAAGKVAGADTFYGTLDSGSSGGLSFRSGGSYGSRKKNSPISAKSLLKDYNVRSGISSVVSGVITAKTGSFQAGAAGYFFTNALLNGISKF